MEVVCHKLTDEGLVIYLLLCLWICYSAGNSLVVKAWNLRPSLVWKDGHWIEQSRVRDKNTKPYEVYSTYILFSNILCISFSGVELASMRIFDRPI